MFFDMNMLVKTYLSLCYKRSIEIGNLKKCHAHTPLNFKKVKHLWY